MLTICVPILADNEGRALFQRLCEAYGMRLHRMAMLRTEDMVASEAQGNGHPGQFYESRDPEVLFQEKAFAFSQFYWYWRCPQQPLCPPGGF